MIKKLRPYYTFVIASHACYIRISSKPICIPECVITKAKYMYIHNMHVVHITVPSCT